MKAELQKKLIEKYSEFFTTDRKIYVGEKPTMEEVSELLNQKEIVLPIQFGIECDNGWYFLLDNLMNCIQNYCKNNKVDPINITQIKEKYGALSFYYNGGDKLIDGMVWLAEDLSYKICERCGSTKNVKQTEGWIITLCEKCMKKHK
jgi:hypothetical protein